MLSALVEKLKTYLSLHKKILATHLAPIAFGRVRAYFRLELLLILLICNSCWLFAQVRETAEDHFSRLMREGFGSDNAVRSAFRDLIQENRRLVGTLKQIDLDKVKRLTTPDSIADPDSAV